MPWSWSLSLSSSEWIAIGIAAAVVFAPQAWQVTRHAATLVHEAGHALVAVATGRRLNGIRLHSDTSGLTVSTGRRAGIGMLATAAAGYPAPSLVGLGVIALVEAGRNSWALAATLLILATMVLYIRNWFGLLVVASAGATAAIVTYRIEGPAQTLALQTFSWFLLFAGARAAIELWSHRRSSRSRTSDADLLARLTHVPAALWNIGFIAVALAAVGAAVRLIG